MGVDILDIQHWVEDQMSELFSTTKQNISLHIGNIFREGELIKEVVVKDFFTTTIHGAIPGVSSEINAAHYHSSCLIFMGE